MLPPPRLPLDNYSVTVKRSMSGRPQSRTDVYGLRAARNPTCSGPYQQPCRSRTSRARTWRSKPGRLSL